MADHKFDGKTFGQLVVVGLIVRDGKRNAILVCECTCGQTAQVRADNLVSGNTQSCGCFGKEQRAKGSKRYAAKQAKAKKRKELAARKRAAKRNKRGPQRRGGKRSSGT